VVLCSADGPGMGPRARIGRRGAPNGFDSPAAALVRRKKGCPVGSSPAAVIERFGGWSCARVYFASEISPVPGTIMNFVEAHYFSVSLGSSRSPIWGRNGVCVWLLR
jgi:hypothetical protein